MKKIIACLLMLTVFTTVKAQNDEPYRTKSLAGVAIQKVAARTSGGSIEVVGRTAGENRVDVYIKSSNGNKDISKEEIQKRLDEDYILDITIEGNQLNVTAKQKNNSLNWRKGLSISFKIYVAPNVTTDLHTSGGSIRLANLSGKQDFSTSGGSLSIDQLSGNINGKTSGGSIRVTNSKDEINLTTSGGSIQADGCKGNLKLSTSGGSIGLIRLEGIVDANTSGGSIMASEITAETTLHTSGGSVTVKNLAGSLDASTSGGGMNIAITKLGKYVKLANSGGGIGLTLPDGKGLNLKLRSRHITVPSLKNFSGMKSEDEIDGTLNGGGIPVEVRASSGSIMMAFN